MKRFIYLIPIVFVSILLFTSCKKDESYLQNVAGTWVYSDASTGYTSSLTIEDIAGGQYASCMIISPTKMLAGQTEGSFIYSAETGSGYIKSDMLGAPLISVQSIKGNNDHINVTSTITDSEGSHSYTYQFSLVPATSLETLPVGKWEGSAKIGEINFNVGMDVTSSVPVNNSCGTMVVEAESESIIANIDSISKLVLSGDNTALGIMQATSSVDSPETIDFIIEYNLVTKDLKISSDDMSVVLNAVNLN